MKIKMDTGHAARMEEGRNAFKILIGRPIGKKPLERRYGTDLTH